jgi:hypothetical protein
VRVRCQQQSAPSSLRERISLRLSMERANVPGPRS